MSSNRLKSVGPAERAKGVDDLLAQTKYESGKRELIPYTQVPKTLISTPDLNAVQKCILFFVLSFERQDKPANFSYEFLGNALGASHATVARALHDLRSGPNKQFDIAKRGYANLYTFCGNDSGAQCKVPNVILSHDRLTPAEKVLLIAILHAQGKAQSMAALAVSAGLSRSSVYAMLTPLVSAGVLAKSGAGGLLVNAPSTWKLANRASHTTYGTEERKRRPGDHTFQTRKGFKVVASETLDRITNGEEI